MDRRAFLQSTGTLLGATLLPSAGLQASPSTGRSKGPRQVLSLNRGWRFSPKRLPDAHAGDFDDASFERIALPHANVRTPWHSFDEKTYQFVSTYRRHFRLPAQARDKRIFVDFEGVMTAASVWLNGVHLGEYRGGFTPFSFELTRYIDVASDNVLAVEVDSTERADIPPFGYQLDYLTFGGIYREAWLRIVSSSFIENIFAKPSLAGSHPTLEVDCFLQHGERPDSDLRLNVELWDGDRKLAQASEQVVTGQEHLSVRFAKLPHVQLWSLEQPQLYSVRVQLLDGSELIDQDQRCCGFRTARFTEHGFELNGKVVKLRGLNRHQTFPFVGGAMPARVQRRDAQILRNELKCNIVRTSHYPQSRHFLDACDQLGLLVLEEIPGWQHIGDEAWKSLAIDNVRRMIRRDWNHPSIVLWGVRINESSDDHDFYARTNALAHELDPTRQTGGIRAFQESELLEDVFTMNDFGLPLKLPNHPRYLNTEFAGHTYNTKSTDGADRLMEHVLRHARVHDQLASDPQFAGGIAWCAFDYNTHADFGSGDRICYHGVADIFREPKRAAGFYRSQCDPREEVVVDPAVHWAPSDAAGGLQKLVVCSNCDHLKLYVGDKPLSEVNPDREGFPHLTHPPFRIDFSDQEVQWDDLRIEGYIGGKQVIVKRYSGKGIDQRFELMADDARLNADGSDCTRVVFRVTDEFGNVRPYANEPITLRVEGPGELIGDNPFVLVGGIGAVWIRTQEQGGQIRVTASHPRLGERSVDIASTVTSSELI